MAAGVPESGAQQLCFPECPGEALEARERVMSAHIWRDGRLFGFDGVEWLTWLIAVAAIGVLALAVTI